MNSRTKKVVWALIGGTASLVALAWLYAYRIGPTDFSQPLKVVSAEAFPDGGTLQVHLVDVHGKPISAKREGKVGVDPIRQQLHVITYVWGIPVERNAPIGSPMDRLVKDSLKAWVDAHMTAEQKTRLEAKSPELLQSLPFEVIVSYDLLTWLDRRKE